MEKKLVIFGAGGGALKVIKTLKNLSISIDFLTDNNPKMWNTIIEGITVIEPNKLSKLDCSIIIASDYQEEIEKQLEELGILDKLIIKEEYILAYINEQEDEIKKIIAAEKVSRQFSPSKVIIDLLECTEYGGIEIWSYLVSDGLLKKGYEVNVLGTADKIGIPEHLRYCLQETNISYENYIQSVIEIAKKIYRQLPCSIIINRQGQTFIAAYIIKKIFPDQIKIISIIHTDRIILHRRQAYMQNRTDAIAGVSRTINKRLIEEFGIPKEKIHFKESPVIFCSKFHKEYSGNKEPLMIGYAARITKTQKRADLLLKLVELLEKENINYHMNIAGDGMYLPTLKEYIDANQYDNHVNVLGQIQRERMEEFWKKQDVFINISEFEGTSLSMLEAMSFGVVPIVTRVSGVQDIISDGESGFICEQHDIESMKKYIALLESDRDLLRRVGENARKEIKIKCNEEKYINYITGLME